MSAIRSGAGRPLMAHEVTFRIRYSGAVRIRVTYVDQAGQYRCHVRDASERATVHVRPPAISDRAVDSPEAFDDAARAAIAFAQHQSGAFEGIARESVTTDGCTVDRVYVGRTLSKAWPSPHGASAPPLAPEAPPREGLIPGATFTVQAGRQIYRNGRPFISIAREGDTAPTTADGLVHLFAAYLARLGYDNGDPRGRFTTAPKSAPAVADVPATPQEPD